MIFSIDAEKTFDKIQHPFMIKPLKRLGIEQTPQHSEGHLQQTHSHHHAQWRKIETVFSKISIRIRMPTVIAPIKYGTGSLAGAVGQDKEEGVQIGKGEVVLLLLLMI